MTLYQLRTFDYSTPRLERKAFTCKADADRAFRAACKSLAVRSGTASLLQVTTPDRLTLNDWAAILSDGPIPGLTYERLISQSFSEKATA